MKNINELLEEYPVFLELETSSLDLMLTIAVVALSQTGQEAALEALPELPEALEDAIALMNPAQARIMLGWLTARLPDYQEGE